MLNFLTKIRKLSTVLFQQTPTAPMNGEVKIVRKPRYDGRYKKRQWEDRRSDKGEALNPTHAKIIKKDTPITTDLIEKIKRRKIVLLLGYSGTNYYGMQRNPNTRTIEEVLFESLLKNEYINEENFAQVQTMQFQRAARTDKGVSAARQVVSLKMRESIETDKINEHLPPEVRLFGYRRVTKGFNSKVQCDARSYIYILPTVAFVPRDVEMAQDGYRIDQGTLDRISHTLEKYVGTKNFHNFTSKKKSNDPSAKRYMKSFDCDAPFVRDNVEFVVLRVRGQSFMLHQIRKMVGLVLAVIKGHTSEAVMDSAFGMERVNVPRAPGLGLVLDFVHYERYNNRYGSDGVHDTLLWEEEEKQVQTFKENFIYPTIINTEIKERSMVTWLSEKLVHHAYDNLEENDAEEDKSDDEEEKR